MKCSSPAAVVHSSMQQPNNEHTTKNPIIKMINYIETVESK
jgi:hypothetical protein